MAEYIDLNNTEVLAEAGANAKLVVEEDGELKRVPASAVGQVKTVNGVEPDEAGNVDVSGLPEGVPVIQSATVGQTVVVKAVDENGKPTEWEAADMGGGGVTLWEYSNETFQPSSSSSGANFYHIPLDISSFKWVEVVFCLRAAYGRSATRFVVVRHLVSDLIAANPDNPFQTSDIKLKTITEAESNYFTLVTAVLNYREGKFIFDDSNQFEFKHSISNGSVSVVNDYGSGVGVVPFKIVGYYE